MSAAELNILINVRAKEARVLINKLQGAVLQLDTALNKAAGSVSRFNGSVATMATPLNSANTSMALLAKNLALIGKSGSVRSLDRLAANAGLAATALLDAAAAAELLNGVLGTTIVRANSTAAALERMAGASAAMSTVGTAGAAAGAGMAAAGAGAGMAATSAKKASGAISDTGKKVGSTGKELQRFTGNWEQYAGKTKVAGKEIDLFRNNLGATTRNVTDYSGKVGKTVPIMSGFTESIGKGDSRVSKMATNLKNMGDKLSSAGSKMQWAGRQMSLYFTAPTAIAIGLGTKWILDLEKQRTTLLKVYGDVDDSFAKRSGEVNNISSQLKKLSNETGTSQEEFMGMAAAWAQAGKSGQELVNATELTNKAMIVGELTAQQASEGMQAVGLQWQLSSRKAKGVTGAISEMESALSILNMASNITQVSFQDLFVGMEKVGGVAKVLGFTFRETSALLTTIAKVTGSASTAGNGLKTIMTRLLVPTEAATNELAKLGIVVNGQEWRSKSPMERLKEISTQVSNMGVDDLARFNKEFSGLYQITRGAQIFKDLQDPKNGNFAKVMRNTSDDLNQGTKSFRAWQEEIRIYMDSNPQKFKIAGTMIKNSLMDVVIVLLPYLLKAAQWIAKMAQAFADSSPFVQKLVLAVLIFLGLIGPLAAFFGALQILFGTFAKTLAFFGGAYKKAGTEATAGSAAISGASAKAGKSAGFLSVKAKEIGIVWNKVAYALRLTGGSAEATAAQMNAAAAFAAKSQATSGSRIVATHSAVAKGMINSTRGLTEAEIALYRAKGRLIETTVATQGAAQTATVARTGQMQLAAVAATQNEIQAVQTASHAKLLANLKAQQASAAAILASGQAKQTATVAAGEAEKAAAITAGSAKQATALSAGSAKQVAQVRANGAAIVSTQNVVAKGMVNSTMGMTEAEIALYRAKGRLVNAEVAASGATQAATVARTNQLQIASTAATQSEIQAVQAAGHAKLMAQLKTQQASTAALLASGKAKETATVAAGEAKKAAAVTAGGAKMMTNTSASYSRLLAATKSNQALINSLLVQSGTVQAATVTASEAKKTAAYRTGGAAQIATVRSTQAGITSATVAGGAATTAAAAKNGTAAAAAGGAAAKKGGARFGGILGTVLLAATFISPSKWKEWGTKLKGLATKALEGLKGVFSRMGINSAKGLGQGLVKGLGGKGGPIVAAIAAIGGMLLYAFEDIKKMAGEVFGKDSGVPVLARPFVFAVKAIGIALSKLPSLVKDAFVATYNFIIKIAKKIYEAFSYINPFARHSPSLVENVQNGMAQVTNEFGDATKSIQSQMLSAYASISKFGNATSNLKIKAEVINDNKTKKDLDTADPGGGASKAYFALNNQVKSLQARLVSLNSSMIKQQRVVDSYTEAVKKADATIAQMEKQLSTLQKVADLTAASLDAAQAKLDYYANAPLKGMKAMNDAIFENSMAQKKLQLQIMDIEDASGSVDNLTDSYAKLQGQIETLSGERAALQAKGAGSDILGQYDKMIADLKAQQGQALSGPSAEVAKLNTQLTNLQRQSERLDLVNSLKFDPLKKQIEDVVNTEKELDFSTAINGVTRYKDQVAIFTATNDMANASVTAQQAVIDAASTSRDALQAKLDQEQEKLDGIKSVYDQVSTAIDNTKTAMDEITTAASTVVSYMDELKQKQEEAANAADKHKDSIDSLKDSMGDLTEQSYDTDFKADADKVDDDTNNKLNGMGDKIKEKLTGIWDKIKTSVTEGVKKIGTWLLDEVKKLPGQLWDAVWYIIGFLIGLLIKGVAGLIKWQVIGLPKMIAEWLAKLDWSSILDTIIWALNPMNWPEIWLKIVKAGGNLVLGILEGIANFMMNIGTWLKEHMIDPLIEGFKDGMGIHSPSTVFFGFGGDIITGLLNGLLGFIGGVLKWFGELPIKFANAIGDIAKPIGELFRKAWNWIKDKLPEWADPIVKWFENLPNLIKSMLTKVQDIVKTPINFIIGTVYNNGLRKIWNNTAGKVGLTEMPEVQKLATGGTVGGRITGPGTGTSDSIFTTAKPGSEIFTASEVRNAGGFRGLEALLFGMGVRGGSGSGGSMVPVALSNGEYKLDPSQVNQLGGSDVVKKLRAQLATGGVPGHGLGDKVKDVAKGAMEKVGSPARKGAAKIVESALNLLGKAIPELLDPPGGEIGKMPKGVFNSTKQGIVDTIAGTKHRYGGTIPRFATGGTVPATSAGGSGGATGGTTATSGDPAADGANAAGLSTQVAAETAAALAAWQAYVTAVEALMATHYDTEQATFTAQNSAMLALAQAQTAALTADAIISTTSLSTQWTTYRANEIVAFTTWYAQLLTMATGFGTSLNSAFQSALATVKANFETFRTDVAKTFSDLAIDLEETVTGKMTETFETLADLLTTTEENFETTVTNIGESWAGLKKGTADPVNYTISTVYNEGLLKVWNGVADLIGAKPMTAAQPIALRTGGPVQGGTSPNKDTVPAMLAKDEYVLSANAVKRAGGVDNLNKFNFGSGNPQGMFNIGGDYRVHLVTGGPADPGSPSWKALQRGHLYARRVAPGPYGWGASSGGVKGGPTDCSGWQSEIADVIMGGPGGQRRWATGSFPGGGGAQGTAVTIGNQLWLKGLGAGHSIGVSVPHTAGTLGGVPGLPTLNIESGGGTGRGANYGAPSTGADDPQFPTRYHLAIVDGAFVSGGGAAGASMMEILGAMIDPGLKQMVAEAEKYQGQGIAGTWPLNIAKAWDKQTRSKIDEEGKKLDAIGPSVAGDSGAGVDRWRPMVIAALKKQGFQATPAEVTAMLGQIYDESKGDPNAINNWDINAQNGTPSRGLLQTIPSTFETFRDPSIEGGITDPWANMNAALRYYKYKFPGMPLDYRWGRGKGGYDSGGWLPTTPNGYSTFYNHTGKPEAVLTDPEWKAIYKSAKKPVLDVRGIAEGFEEGIKNIFGTNSDEKIADIMAESNVALEGQNATWNPLMYDAEKAAAEAAQSTTDAVKQTTTAVDGTTSSVNNVASLTEDQTKQIQALTKTMSAIGTGMASITVDKDGKITMNNTFGAMAPAITALGELIETLPESKPTYVSWAGTNATVTDEMKREKAANDAANASKGLYEAFRTVAPPVLKHTAIIGTAVEQLVQQDSAAWGAALTMMAQNNPVGYLIAIILVLKEIMVLLPLIINAIMEIGPAIIQSLIKYFTKFEPDSVYAYGSYEAANEAVNNNQTAIRNGATAPTFETIQNEGNSEVTFNFYGDVVMPNVTNESGADNLLDNLLGLAGL